MKSPNAIGDNVKIFISLYDIYLEDGFSVKNEVKSELASNK